MAPVGDIQSSPLFLSAVCGRSCRGEKSSGPFPFLDRAQDPRDGRLGELLVHSPLDLAIDRCKDALDVPTHRAEGVGLAPVQGNRLALRLDRPEHVQERDSPGGDLEPPTAADSPLGLDDPGLAEPAEQAADDHGIGVDAPGDVLRGLGLVRRLREQGQDVDADGELGTEHRPSDS